MKIKTSVLMAGGLGVALWAGVVSHGVLAQADTGPVKTPVHAPIMTPSPVAPDAARRAELGRRLSAMLAEGRGGRLADAPTHAPLPAARQTTRSAAPTQPVRASRRSPSSAYVQPRLDLSSAVSKPSDPVTCLTQAVYYEAGRESEEGRAAVAEVVMNRAASGRYPSDICEVVYQRNARTCQFTFTCDGSIGRHKVDPASWAQADRIARQVYSAGYQSILPKRSVNYHANYVNPTWSARLERVRSIGAHIFYGASLDNRGTPGADERQQPTTGLLFVKNEAIERAYATLMGRDAASNP